MTPARGVRVGVCAHECGLGGRGRSPGIGSSKSKQLGEGTGSPKLLLRGMPRIARESPQEHSDEGDGRGWPLKIEARMELSSGQASYTHPSVRLVPRQGPLPFSLLLSGPGLEWQERGNPHAWIPLGILLCDAGFSLPLSEPRVPGMHW